VKRQRPGVTELYLFPLDGIAVRFTCRSAQLRSSAIATENGGDYGEIVSPGSFYAALYGLVEVLQRQRMCDTDTARAEGQKMWKKRGREENMRARYVGT